jgi:hypothetical protein
MVRVPSAPACGVDHRHLAVPVGVSDSQMPMIN